MGTSMYSLSLHAAHRSASGSAWKAHPRRTRLTSAPVMNSGRRGLSAWRARDRPASGRQRSSSGWPTGRALAVRSWPESGALGSAGRRGRSSVRRGPSPHRAAVGGRLGVLRAIDAPERGSQRGSGVPRARRGPKPLRRLEQRTGLVVELIRRITLGARNGVRRRVAPNSICRRSAMPPSLARPATVANGAYRAVSTCPGRREARANVC